MSNLSNLKAFQQLVPNFGLNIVLNTVQNHIDDAVSDYLTPSIGKDLVKALETAMNDYRAIAIYDPLVSYSVGSKIRFENYVYRAETGFGTPPGNNWTRLKIFDLLADYVVPYVTYKAAARFFVFHGANVDQFGLHSNSGAEFTQVSDKTRAAMSGDMERKAAKALLEVRDFLTLESWTIDGVKYVDPTKTKPTAKPDFGITPIKPRWP